MQNEVDQTIKNYSINEYSMIWIRQIIQYLNFQNL